MDPTHVPYLGTHDSWLHSEGKDFLSFISFSFFSIIFNNTFTDVKTNMLMSACCLDYRSISPFIYLQKRTSYNIKTVVFPSNSVYHSCINTLNFHGPSCTELVSYSSAVVRLQQLYITEIILTSKIDINPNTYYILLSGDEMCCDSYRQ